MLRNSILRAPLRSAVARAAAPSGLQQRFASAHAISNPTLANIEKRWETMPPQEQADLWMALRDRMKVNWAQLTPQEQKAGMCRFPPDPDGLVGVVRGRASSSWAWRMFFFFRRMGSRRLAVECC